MKFTSEGEVRIVVPAKGLDIQIGEDGNYDTDDPDEIYELERHPLVEAEGAGLEEHEAAAEPPEPPAHESRAGLNARALAAGVSSPEDLPNKAAVRQAIEDIEAQAAE